MSKMKVFMKVADIPGSSSDQNHSDWCDVRGFSHEMNYPFDMRDNRGAGEPVHGALKVTKEIDKASPKLYECLVKKKKVANVEFEFWRDNPNSGGSEKYFTMKIGECRVVNVHPYMHVGNEPGVSQSEDLPPHLEEIGFAYRTIDWTWLSGGQVPTTFDFSNPDS